MEAEDIKREINKIETSEGCNINSVKLTSDLGSKIIQNLIAAELKEKDIIISEYHIKMIADKESYFEVVESYGDLESQLKAVSTLNDSFPNGLGDYEWKIIENFNSKNFRIAELESQLKEVKEENRHLSNYAVHTQFCAWRNNGNGICDCGYIKNQN